MNRFLGGILIVCGLIVGLTFAEIASADPKAGETETVTGGGAKNVADTDKECTTKKQEEQKKAGQTPCKRVCPVTTYSTGTGGTKSCHTYIDKNCRATLALCTNDEMAEITKQGGSGNYTTAPKGGEPQSGQTNVQPQTLSERLKGFSDSVKKAFGLEPVSPEDEQNSTTVPKGVQDTKPADQIDQIVGSSKSQDRAPDLPPPSGPVRHVTPGPVEALRPGEGWQSGNKADFGDILGPAWTPFYSPNTFSGFMPTSPPLSAAPAPSGGFPSAPPVVSSPSSMPAPTTGLETTFPGSSPPPAPKAIDPLNFAPPSTAQLTLPSGVTIDPATLFASDPRLGGFVTPSAVLAENPLDFPQSPSFGLPEDKIAAIVASAQGDTTLSPTEGIFVAQPLQPSESNFPEVAALEPTDRTPWQQATDYLKNAIERGNFGEAIQEGMKIATRNPLPMAKASIVAVEALQGLYNRFFGPPEPVPAINPKNNDPGTVAAEAGTPDMTALTPGGQGREGAVALGDANDPGVVGETRPPVSNPDAAVIEERRFSTPEGETVVVRGMASPEVLNPVDNSTPRELAVARDRTILALREGEAERAIRSIDSALDTVFTKGGPGTEWKMANGDTLTQRQLVDRLLADRATAETQLTSIQQRARELDNETSARTAGNKGLAHAYEQAYAARRGLEQEFRDASEAYNYTTGEGPCTACRSVEEKLTRTNDVIRQLDSSQYSPAVADYISRINNLDPRLEGWRNFSQENQKNGFKYLDAAITGIHPETGQPMGVGMQLLTGTVGLAQMMTGGLTEIPLIFSKQQDPDPGFQVLTTGSGDYEGYRNLEFATSFVKVNPGLNPGGVGPLRALGRGIGSMAEDFGFTSRAGVNSTESVAQGIGGKAFSVADAVDSAPVTSPLPARDVGAGPWQHVADTPAGPVFADAPLPRVSETPLSATQREVIDAINSAGGRVTEDIRPILERAGLGTRSYGTVQAEVTSGVGIRATKETLTIQRQAIVNEAGEVVAVRGAVRGRAASRYDQMGGYQTVAPTGQRSTLSSLRDSFSRWFSGTTVETPQPVTASTRAATPGTSDSTPLLTYRSSSDSASGVSVPARASGLAPSSAAVPSSAFPAPAFKGNPLVTTPTPVTFPTNASLADILKTGRPGSQSLSAALETTPATINIESIASRFAPGPSPFGEVQAVELVRDVEQAGKLAAMDIIRDELNTLAANAERGVQAARANTERAAYLGAKEEYARAAQLTNDSIRAAEDGNRALAERHAADADLAETRARQFDVAARWFAEGQDIGAELRAIAGDDAPRLLEAARVAAPTAPPTPLSTRLAQAFPFTRTRAEWLSAQRGSTLPGGDPLTQPLRLLGNAMRDAVEGIANIVELARSPVSPAPVSQVARKLIEQGRARGVEITVVEPAARAVPTTLNYHGLEATQLSPGQVSPVVKIEEAARAATGWLNRPTVTAITVADRASLTTAELADLRKFLADPANDLLDAHALNEAGKLRNNAITALQGPLDALNNSLARVSDINPAVAELKRLYAAELFPAGRAYDLLPLSSKVEVTKKLDALAVRYLEIVTEPGAAPLATRPPSFIAGEGVPRTPLSVVERDIINMQLACVRFNCGSDPLPTTRAELRSDPAIREALSRWLADDRLSVAFRTEVMPYVPNADILREIMGAGSRADLAEVLRAAETGNYLLVPKANAPQTRTPGAAFIPGAPNPLNPRGAPTLAPEGLSGGGGTRIPQTESMASAPLNLARTEVQRVITSEQRTNVANSIGNGHAFTDHARELGVSTRTELGDLVNRTIQEATDYRLSGGTHYYMNRNAEGGPIVVAHSPNGLDKGTIFRLEGTNPLGQFNTLRSATEADATARVVREALAPVTSAVVREPSLPEKLIAQQRLACVEFGCAAGELPKTLVDLRNYPGAREAFSRWTQSDLAAKFGDVFESNPQNFAKITEAINADIARLDEILAEVKRTPIAQVPAAAPVLGNAPLAPVLRALNREPALAPLDVGGVGSVPTALLKNGSAAERAQFVGSIVEANARIFNTGNLGAFPGSGPTKDVAQMGVFKQQLKSYLELAIQRRTAFTPLPSRLGEPSGLYYRQFLSFPERSVGVLVDARLPGGGTAFVASPERLAVVLERLKASDDVANISSLISSRDATREEKFIAELRLARAAYPSTIAGVIPKDLQSFTGDAALMQSALESWSRIGMEARYAAYRDNPLTYDKIISAANTEDVSKLQQILSEVRATPAAAPSADNRVMQAMSRSNLQDSVSRARARGEETLSAATSRVQNAIGAASDTLRARGASFQHLEAFEATIKEAIIADKNAPLKSMAGKFIRDYGLSGAQEQAVRQALARTEVTQRALGGTTEVVGGNVPAEIVAEGGGLSGLLEVLKRAVNEETSIADAAARYAGANPIAAADRAGAVEYVTGALELAGRKADIEGTLRALDLSPAVPAEVPVPVVREVIPARAEGLVIDATELEARGRTLFDLQHRVLEVAPRKGSGLRPFVEDALAQRTVEATLPPGVTFEEYAALNFIQRFREGADPFIAANSQARPGYLAVREAAHGAITREGTLTPKVMFVEELEQEVDRLARSVYNSKLPYLAYAYRFSNDALLGLRQQLMRNATVMGESPTAFHARVEQSLENALQKLQTAMENQTVGGAVKQERIAKAVAYGDGLRAFLAESRATTEGVGAAAGSEPRVVRGLGANDLGEAFRLYAQDARAIANRIAESSLGQRVGNLFRSTAEAPALPASSAVDANQALMDARHAAFRDAYALLTEEERFIANRLSIDAVPRTDQVFKQVSARYRAADDALQDALGGRLPNNLTPEDWQRLGRSLAEDIKNGQITVQPQEAPRLFSQLRDALEPRTDQPRVPNVSRINEEAFIAALDHRYEAFKNAYSKLSSAEKIWVEGNGGDIEVVLETNPLLQKELAQYRNANRELQTLLGTGKGIAPAAVPVRPAGEALANAAGEGTVVETAEDVSRGVTGREVPVPPSIQVVGSAGATTPLPASARVFPLSPESPIKSMIAIPRADVPRDMRFVAPPETQLMYRGLGETFNPNFRGGDGNYFTPDLLEARARALGAAKPGAEPDVVIVAVDPEAMGNLEVYRRVQVLWDERAPRVGEPLGGYVDVPPEWFATSGAIPLTKELEGLASRYAALTKTNDDAAIAAINAGDRETLAALNTERDRLLKQLADEWFSGSREAVAPRALGGPPPPPETLEDVLRGITGREVSVEPLTGKTPPATTEPPTQRVVAPGYPTVVGEDLARFARDLDGELVQSRGLFDAAERDLEALRGQTGVNPQKLIDRTRIAELRREQLLGIIEAKQALEGAAAKGSSAQKEALALAERRLTEALDARARAERIGSARVVEEPAVGSRADDVGAKGPPEEPPAGAKTRAEDDDNRGRWAGFAAFLKGAPGEGNYLLKVGIPVGLAGLVAYLNPTDQGDTPPPQAKGASADETKVAPKGPTVAVVPTKPVTPPDVTKPAPAPPTAPPSGAPNFDDQLKKWQKNPGPGAGYPAPDQDEVVRKIVGPDGKTYPLDSPQGRDFMDNIGCPAGPCQDGAIAAAKKPIGDAPPAPLTGPKTPPTAGQPAPAADKGPTVKPPSRTRTTPSDDTSGRRKTAGATPTPSGGGLPNIAPITSLLGQLAKLFGQPQSPAPAATPIPVAPLPPPAVLRFSCDPLVVRPNGTTTIAWVCSDGAKSVGVGFDTKGASSGSMQQVLVATTTFSVSCGVSAPRSCTVGISSAAPASTGGQSNTQQSKQNTNTVTATDPLGQPVSLCDPVVGINGFITCLTNGKW